MFIVCMFALSSLTPYSKCWPAELHIRSSKRSIQNPKKKYTHIHFTAHRHHSNPLNSNNSSAFLFYSCCVSCKNWTAPALSDFQVFICRRLCATGVCFIVKRNKFSFRYQKFCGWRIKWRFVRLTIWHRFSDNHHVKFCRQRNSIKKETP